MYAYTNLYKILTIEFLKLYKETTIKKVPIRRIGISFGRVQEQDSEQLNLFENIDNKTKERKLEKLIIEIKSKYGKNSVLKGMNLQEGATTIIRNKLIGGHNGY